VRERLAADGHLQAVHVREVRGAQPAWWVLLGEENLAGRTVLRLPLPHTTFQGAAAGLPVDGRLLTLEPLEQGLGLQARLGLQQLFQPGPDLGQGIGSGSPGVGGGVLTGKRLPVAILACGFAIHARLHRCQRQRSSLMAGVTQVLDLGVGYASSLGHRQLLCGR
jgi:hypothetical protein